MSVQAENEGQEDLNNKENTGEEKVEKSNPDLDARINALVEARLKDGKNKIDTAYSKLDEANAKIAAFEKKEREAEIARLEAEGNLKEAYEMKLADAEKAKAAAEARTAASDARVTELTRDLNLKTALSAHPFRNENAQDMAFKELVGGLVNVDGVWQPKSGGSITDYVKAFRETEANAFLFKAKTSTGGGLDTVNSATINKTDGSLFSMGQDKVIELALAGKLPRRK